MAISLASGALVADGEVQEEGKGGCKCSAILKNEVVRNDVSKGEEVREW